MKTMVTTVMTRGQVAVPAAVRRSLHLEPGTRLLWETAGDSACRITVQRPVAAESAADLLGYARTFRRTRRTAEWMAELRAGEES